MIIDSNGITKSSLTDYLTFWTVELQKVYGSNFVIRKEGIVDNLATASSLTNLALEDVILYLAKNMNPYTAEGEYQDALYALIGLTRQYATFTKVTRTIQGTAGTFCDVGSIRFKNIATEDIFRLNTAVTIGESGIALGSFTAIELGSIDLPSDANLEIIDAPQNIEAVYYTSDNITTLGDDYEDDSEFRLRWLATNSIRTGSGSEGGMRSSLLPLVGNNANNIKIRQNRNRITYDDIPLHSMNIVVKSSESNENIANAIFENLTDGVGLEGTTAVTVKDVENQDVEIRFTRATSVPVYFNIRVILKNGFILSDVSDIIKNAIVENFSYEVGERIVANDFYQYINSIDGIDYVTALEVSDEDDNYTSTLSLNYSEYGTVIVDNITVSEA